MKRDRLADGTWITSLVELTAALVAGGEVILLGLPLGPLSYALLAVAGLSLMLAIVAGPAIALRGSGREGAAFDILGASGVQLILFVVWLGLLVLFTTTLHIGFRAGCHTDQDWAECLGGDKVALWAACLTSLPKVLSFVAALIISRGDDRRLGVMLPAPTQTTTALASATTNAQSMWSYEASKANASIRRAVQHAGLMGSFASIALMACAAVFLPTSPVHVAGLGTWAVAVATAVSITFVLELTTALGRAANDDASTRMFARAGRSVVIGAVAATAASAFLFKEAQGPLGGALIGASCALLGPAALRAMTDRASSFLGVKPAVQPNVLEPTTLEGLSQDDATRLSEEGIDSVHALAFCPTARLFFNTRFSLQRICDWQDQALLVAYAGKEMAGKLREQFFIRGALDAQFLATVMMNVAPLEAGQDMRSTRVSALVLALKSQPDWDKQVASTLGFDPIRARVAFATLVNDELIDRLRLYWRAATQVSPEDD